MKKRNITREKIFQAAIQVIEERGLDSVTFPLIAEKLQIKTPSMYNHFKNIAVLKGGLSFYLYEKLNQQVHARIQGKSGKPAIKMFTMTIFEFAFAYPNTYPLLSDIIEITDKHTDSRGAEAYSETLRELLRAFTSDPDELLFFHRAIRSYVHGYISLNLKGFFKLSETENTYQNFEIFSEQMLQLLLR